MKHNGKKNAGRGQRNDILKEIQEKLRLVKTAFLASPLEVEADFLGGGYPIVVRKIAVAPGYGPETLEFLVGTDEYGNPVTTNELETEDLQAICSRM